MEAEPGRFLSRRPAPAGATVDLATWLDDFARQPEHRGALVHRATLPARAARYGALSAPLQGPLTEALESRGIARLYTHQVQALESLRGGLDPAVGTCTASGKRRCSPRPGA